MKRRISLSICAFAAIGLLVMGCGGSSGHAPPPSCLRAQPCGGDVTGAWSFLGGCTNLAGSNAELSSSCPGASVLALGLTFSGQLTFNADLTYTASNWHETFSGSENVPLSCAGAASCAALSGTMSDTVATITETCTGTSTCACRVSGSLTIASDAGTFSTSGTAISMTGTTTSGSFAYCVEGDLLHLMQQSTTAVDASGQPVLLSDLVAQRKTP